jgi:hypothetical protein
MNDYMAHAETARDCVKQWTRAHDVDPDQCFGFEARAEGPGRPVLQFWTYKTGDDGRPTTIGSKLVTVALPRVQSVDWPL